MNLHSYYETVSEATNALVKQGYTFNFNLKDDTLHCLENDKQLNPSEFIIDKMYRFEENSDPDDNMVVYAISSQKNDLKGILVNAYGVYTEQSSDELISKLEMKR